MASKHACKHEARPPLVKKKKKRKRRRKRRSVSILVLFVLV